MSRRVLGTQPNAVTTLRSPTRPRQSTTASPTVPLARGVGTVGNSSVRRMAGVPDGAPAGARRDAQGWHHQPPAATRQPQPTITAANRPPTGSG